MLIGVTSFYRDNAVCEYLKVHIFPAMFDELPNRHIIRAWVTGCSIGEEAYSLAIIFKEAFEKIEEHRNLTFQIFATDLDLDAIDKAREGIFSKNIVPDISAERLSRFFNIDIEGYRVSAAIREKAVFALRMLLKIHPLLNSTSLHAVICLFIWSPKYRKN